MKNNYAFIDNQNLNLGIQKLGWKMDWRKFRAFLKEKHGVDKAYMFIGYMPENEDLYNQMHEAGYLVVLKPTLEMFKTPQPEKVEEKEPFRTFGEQAAEGEPLEVSKKTEPETNQRAVKGNVDAELVLWATKEMPHYNKAIIISGDGDFFSLLEYLREQKKLANLMVPNRQYSSLLKPFEDCIVRLDQKKRELSYRHGRFFAKPKK
jgi:uncharacterized LabA/DUF88 family protein